MEESYCSSTARAYLTLTLCGKEVGTVHSFLRVYVEEEDIRLFNRVEKALSPLLSTRRITLRRPLFNRVGQLLNLVVHMALFTHEFLNLGCGVHDRRVVAAPEGSADLGQR